VSFLSMAGPGGGRNGRDVERGACRLIISLKSSIAANDLAVVRVLFRSVFSTCGGEVEIKERCRGQNQTRKPKMA
jgi:hypothetical protein